MVDKPGMTTKVTGKSPKNQARIGWVHPTKRRVQPATKEFGISPRQMGISLVCVGHSMPKMEYLWEYLYYTTN
jgi:hypothetical protein